MDKKTKTNQPVEVSINFDNTPILYTDNVLISVNKDGVVLDVGQKLGNTNKLRIVSRIGMSKEHARKLAQQLAKTLALTSAETPRGKQN